MTYELEILTELRAINGMLVKIFEALKEQQKPQLYQIQYNYDQPFICDHEWVPSDVYTTAERQYHCAKCGVIRA